MIATRVNRTLADDLQDVVAEARGAGVQLKALHRSHHDPYQAIIEAAALSHCESGITGALLGSETVKVLTPGLSAEWTGRVPPLRD